MQEIDVRNLAQTATRNLVGIKMLSDNCIFCIIDCINGSLYYSPTAVEFLMRRAVKREILDQYLRRKGIIVSAAFKGVQVGEVLRLWNRLPHQQEIPSFLHFRDGYYEMRQKKIGSRRAGLQTLWSSVY